MLATALWWEIDALHHEGGGMAVSSNWLLGRACPDALPPRLDFTPSAWCQCLETSWSVEVHPVGSWQFRAGNSVAVSMQESALCRCFDNSSVGLNYAVRQHHSRTIKINHFKSFAINKFGRNREAAFVLLFNVLCRSALLGFPHIIPPLGAFFEQCVKDTLDRGSEIHSFIATWKDGSVLSQYSF